MHEAEEGPTYLRTNQGTVETDIPQEASVEINSSAKQHRGPTKSTSHISITDTANQDRITKGPTVENLKHTRANRAARHAKMKRFRSKGDSASHEDRIIRGSEAQKVAFGGSEPVARSTRRQRSLSKGESNVDGDRKKRRHGKMQKVCHTPNDATAIFAGEEQAPLDGSGVAKPGA